MQKRKRECCGFLLEKETGFCSSILCLVNGGLEEAGFILNQYYTDEKKVRDMFSLGDVEFLDKEIYPKEGVYHFYDNPCIDTTVFRNRDMGYKIAHSIEYDSIESYFKKFVELTHTIEFIWRKGLWHVMMPLKKSNKNYEHFRSLEKKYAGFNNYYIFKLSDVLEIIDREKGKSSSDNSEDFDFDDDDFFI